MYYNLNYNLTTEVNGMQSHPTSIRISKDQQMYLKRVAKAQKHGKIATVIKRLIDREMGVASA